MNSLSLGAETFHRFFFRLDMATTTSSLLFLEPGTRVATAQCKIHWTGCNALVFNSSTLPVPFERFDYTSHNSSEKLTLQLVKAPAPLKSKGSVLFNTGGPGKDNRQDFATLVPNLIPLTDGQYDLIAFDSRGTAGAVPLKCYEDPFQEWEAFNAQIPSNTSDNAAAELWARGAVDAEACAAVGAKNGSVQTSAFVARDLISAGFSYGTTLGATVAAMFPERMDKVILDAVQNVHEYYHAQANYEEWEMSDQVFSSIFTECVKAGPELCPLAAHNKTAEELEAAAYELLDIAKYEPIPVGQLVVDYSAVKSIYAQALYSPRGWGGVITFSPSINSTALYYSILFESDNALAGIYCSDNQKRTENFEDFVPALEKLYSTSRIMGDVPVGSYARCQQRKIKPKETYTGSFNHVQTKNPILYVGNTFDGHTPLKSAYNVSSSFEGSVVLEMDGYGQAYWVNGTLPESGTRCTRSVQPSFKAAGVNATWING
ncbi:uncharacterized protein BDV17DRAFT_278706 [Aspergillus undulatus]|uniref:uncharacterized protein n=1 Tax=Aspergillus undulatus TaxID=1810928 RepID=UPI003CCD9436